MGNRKMSISSSDPKANGATDIASKAVDHSLSVLFGEKGRRLSTARAYGLTFAGYYGATLLVSQDFAKAAYISAAATALTIGVSYLARPNLD